MIYEIRNNGIVIGTTKLESGDPPMGFVHGSVYPSSGYGQPSSVELLTIHVQDSGQQLPFQSVLIEDTSEELGEVCVYVTALINSAEEYERFFRHHIEAYEKQFHQPAVNKAKHGDR